jgi:hypothetical protein
MPATAPTLVIARLDQGGGGLIGLEIEFHVVLLMLLGGWLTARV